jgi:Na+/H+ antiporter NhaD/arsenite permease-like protein
VVFSGGVTAAILIFAATYVVVAIGKLPGLQLDRAGAALLGASLMIATGVLTPDEAYRAVDSNTIALLLGMMIVVANLRLSGFFRVVNASVVRHAHRPLVLLIAIVLLSGVFSAFLVNDTICLVLTPLVLDLLLPLGRNPVPYLLAVAMASNVGSVATITGNPQNMMIGSFSGISYRAFATAMAPIAAIGLLLTIALIGFAYRREFRLGRPLAVVDAPVRYNRALALKAVLVTLGMVAAFFLGQPAPKVALVGGATLLLTRRIKAQKVYREVDWPLLVMFAGLFIVVAGFEKVVLTPPALDALARLPLADDTFMSLVTALLSNIVSNVPAVLVLRPFVAQLPDPQHAWLVVAMSATLAGNFTLLGSVANLIVAQRARAQGVDVSFWTYFAVGAPLTVLTITVGVLLLR